MIDNIKDFIERVPALARQQGIKDTREWTAVDEALKYDEPDFANELILQHLSYFIFDEKEMEDAMRRCLHVFHVFRGRNL